MNEIFKKLKTDRIQLDDFFYLYPDSYKGLVLQREEEKTREKIDKKTKNKTGEVEIYTHMEQWYYPSVSKVLSKYLELKAVEAKSIEELRDIVLRVEETIKNIKEQWK